MNKLKKIIIMCLGVLLLIPSSVLAKSYSSLNLEKTLTSENIKHDLSNYKETNDQITIYMFRGEHCGHCQNFLNFLNDNVEEYGSYFKLVSFEVWKNENNAALASNVAAHFGIKLNGVPFIVIGEKTYQGYSEKSNEEILQTIKNYYENKQTYQDVVSPLLVEKKDDTIGAAITIIVVLATASIIGFMIYMSKEETNADENKEAKQEEKVEIKKAKKEDSKPVTEKKIEKQNLPKLTEKSDINKKSEKAKNNNTSKTAVKKTTKIELPKKKEIEPQMQTTKEKTTKTNTKKATSTNTKATSAKKNTTTVKKNSAKNSTREAKKNNPSKTQATKKAAK